MGDYSKHLRRVFRRDLKRCKRANVGRVSCRAQVPVLWRDSESPSSVVLVTGLEDAIYLTDPLIFLFLFKYGTQYLGRQIIGCSSLVRKKEGHVPPSPPGIDAHA